MKATFQTSGEVQEILDENGKTSHYMVGRIGMQPIRLSKLIGAYLKADKSVYIDKWGNPWVKA